MKILSITAQKPHSTGSGTYLTELVNSWSLMGHEQAVVAGIYPDDEVNLPAGVSFYPVYFSNWGQAPIGKISNRCLSLIGYPIVGMSDAMPYESTRYRDMTPEMIEEFEAAFVQQIKAAIEELNPDIIVCHHLFLLCAIVARNFPDRTIYGICHGTDLRQMVNCPDIAPIVKPEIDKLHHIIALHNQQRDQIAEIFGIPTDRIDAVGSGYNGKLFNDSDRIPYVAGQPVRICYAGKMSKAKGIPELLRALESLSRDDEVPEFKLTLVGGCQEEDVQCMLDNRPDYIDYLGQIPQQELATVYKANDVFVLPSYFEGLNLAVIEAMVSGLLPISTDLPGMQDWINSNVTNSTVRYIPMPKMATIDTPSDAGREDYVINLEIALKQAIKYIADGNAVETPDAFHITWDGIADRIINMR